jgi:hypothetical protein
MEWITITIKIHWHPIGIGTMECWNVGVLEMKHLHKQIPFLLSRAHPSSSLVRIAIPAPFPLFYPSNIPIPNGTLLIKIRIVIA